MSASTGESKSQTSGSSTQWSPYAQSLAKFGIADLKSAQPVLAGLLGQESEALRTGGITNQIPLINRKVDAARQAASQSNQSTRDILAKYGLAGSAFGARTIAEETAQQNQDVANVPANTVEEILGQAPAVALGATGQGFRGLGDAGSLDINSRYNQTTYGINHSDSFSGQDLGALAAA